MTQVDESQVELAQELQDLLLREFRDRIKSGEATSTDLATLARLLQQNGWTLNPADVPKELREHITSDVDPDEEIEKDRHLRVTG